MLQLPDANKLIVVGDGIDEIIWENLPVPTNWVTYQRFQVTGGGSNEFDFEDSTAVFTMNEGSYYIIINADGYEPRLYTVVATTPPPPEDEPLPVEE